MRPFAAALALASLLAAVWHRSTPSYDPSMLGREHYYYVMTDSGRVPFDPDVQIGILPWLPTLGTALVALVMLIFAVRRR